MNQLDRPINDAVHGNRCEKATDEAPWLKKFEIPKECAPGLEWAIRVCDAYLDECYQGEEGEARGATHVMQRLQGWLDSLKHQPEQEEARSNARDQPRLGVGLDTSE